MAMVGTQGYTAPEIIRGELYDSSVDIFSFAVVMAELLATLKQRYAKLREDGGNESWASIQARLGDPAVNVRPLLPKEVDGSLHVLIEACWHPTSREGSSALELMQRLANLSSDHAHGSAKILNSRKSIMLAAKAFHSLLFSVLDDGESAST